MVLSSLSIWQVLQPGLVKGPWTKEEDQIITDCIEAGVTKWSEIAERIPGRIGKQVGISVTVTTCYKYLLLLL